MTLFKRLLLSLFPQAEGDIQINPATLFLNFVSAKQFFSIVLRKLVENYKLYLYDVNFDTFEVKIGFGDKPTLKLTEIDTYFSYINAAEFNGYRFFSLINLSTSFTLLAGYRFRNIFRKYDYKLFFNFLITVNFLFYIFLSRIKVLSGEKEEAYKKFIDIFFNFYLLTNNESKLTIDDETFEFLKTELLKDTEFFLSMFYLMLKLNKVFDYAEVGMKDKDFFERLFYDEINSGKYKNILKDFLNNLDKYQYSVNFSVTERNVMNLILPADTIIRFFFDGPEIYEIIDNILGEVFKEGKVDSLLKKAIRGDKGVRDLVLYLTNYSIYKNNFFKGVKKFIFKTLEVKDHSLSEDLLNDMMSTIGGEIKIPEIVKKQGVIAERMMNFYLTFIGGFWVGRADTFYHRLFKKDLIDKIALSLGVDFNQDVLYVLGGLFYLYGKNVFYYQYAFESVRQGKDSFRLPLRPSFKEVYSSPILIHLFTEVSIISFLEELNIKDIKLYINDRDIIQKFSSLFKENINYLLKLDDNKFIENFFVIFKYLNLEKELNISTFLNKEEIKFLKESLYTIEYWIWVDTLNYLEKRIFNYDKDRGFVSRYLNKLSLVYIFSTLKQTIFGLILLMKYFMKQNSSLDLRLDVIYNIYLNDILILPKKDELMNIFNDLITYLINKYDDIIDYLINIDDNPSFLKIIYENWVSLLSTVKEPEEIPALIRGEDLVWFRGALKYISYYNKRFYIPQI